MPLVYAKFTVRHYDEDDPAASRTKKRKLVKALTKEEQNDNKYYSILKDSIFGGAPCGDNLYSYRFSEILSAGTIPVIYANDWVLPYTPAVLPNSDWSNVAVIIPQENITQTMDILSSFTDTRICQMQRNAFQFYNQYVKDSHGRLNGILKVLDSRLNNDNDNGNTLSNNRNRYYAIPGKKPFKAFATM